MTTLRPLLYMCALGLCAARLLSAGDEAPPPLLDRETINLYANKAPNSEGDALDDMPAIQIVLPKAGTATGASMIVCPGGGYNVLAPHEATPVGEWLAQNGITAFVLRYRLMPKYRLPVPLGDAQRAIRYVRAHAAKWKLDPDRIGILGFSAGGHLAGLTTASGNDGDATAADPIERVSSKVALHVLVYPFVTFGKGTHTATLERILGKTPAPELIDRFSIEKHVDINTPPAFLVHTTADTVLPVAAHTDQYAAALKQVGIKYEYIRGTAGAHGFGVQDFWSVPCIKWLRGKGF